MNLESIVKKLFLSGTLVVGVAVSMMTVGTYAIQECTGTSCATTGVSSQTKFSLTVDKVLTISTNPSSAEITALPNQVATGKLSVGVQTNSPYTISLSAAQPNLVNSADNTQVINASSSVSGTANTWGIKKMDATNTPTGSYVALTSGNVTFLDSSTAAPSSRTSEFEIGVGTTATLPDGTYSTTVTVTAAVK